MKDNKEQTDDELYLLALKEFSNSKYVSTAKIQRLMQLPYSKANMILERMVKEGHASKRIGSYPSFMINGKFKKLKAFQAELITKQRMKNHFENPEEYLK